MHEMSIVEALLDAVRQEIRSHPGAQVQTVRVRIGSLRLVIPETLRFCYAAAINDTPLSGSQLEIETVPAAARCPQCRTEFPVEDNWFQCPQCDALDAKLLSGNELSLTSIELQEVIPA